MEISAYAERILFGATLADKRVAFDRLTDERPGAALGRVDAPARPAALAFTASRMEFPKNLEHDEARGRALHFFVNHELLAAELMALVLLRAVDAPARFRMGLAQTIAEEQKHLGLYLDRMEHLGVELGEVPVNDFFWRSLSDVHDPIDFVAAMSLGFEQANLDFSRHYRDRFLELGDVDTARVLDEVYEDEIRHVRRGVRWYEEALGPLTFEAHARRIAPMSMMRVKGPDFDVEGRHRAGLSADYVDAVRTFAGAKGRAPRWFLFNATAEEEVQYGRRYTAPEPARVLERDLSFVMAYLASPTDVVCAPSPSRAFVRSLYDAGFEPPSASEEAPDEVAEIVPWGWSPRIERIAPSAHTRPGGLGGWPAEDDRLAPQQPRERAEGPEAADAPNARDLYDKRVTVEIAHAFGDAAARVATSIAEVLDAMTGDTIVKSIYGASGRNRCRFPGGVDDNGRGWLARALDRDGAVIVEPWEARWRDFGIVLNVGRKDPLLDVFELLVDARGAYRGHRLAAPHQDFERELRAGFYAHVRRIAEHVAAALHARGYRGPAGVDAFVTRDGRWRSIVDVNARHTMGHVARALKAHVAPKTEAVWWHETSADPRARAESLRAAHPVVMAEGKIASGALMTTDPDRAARTLTMLLVGEAAIEAGLEASPG